MTDENAVENTGEIIGNEDFLKAHFTRVENGWIGYKIFNSVYLAPEHWKIEAGAIITESELNTWSHSDCADGINLAMSVDWIQNFVSDISSDEQGEIDALVWKVLIPDTSIIVIPWNTDGKIRTNQIQLLETVATVYYDTERYDDDDEYDDDDDFDDDEDLSFEDDDFEDDDIIEGDDGDEDEPITQD